MKITTPITLLLLLCLLPGCWKEWGLCHDTELSFKKQDYTGTELRTDGYYYTEDTSKYGGVEVIYLFRNGVSYTDGEQLTDAKNGTIKTPETSSDLVQKKALGGIPGEWECY